ncbi:MAG: SDR family oxidoreductase [Archangiaceae bacterium]|nr:SDR family oxidoreductase [Archangiaceae bacterium]
MAGVAIVGASGLLGEKLIARALERGHRVSALVRDATRVKRQAEQLTVFQIDTETGSGLEAGLERCQFVICAVGGEVGRCVTQLVGELRKRKKGIERLVLLSRLGVAESRPQSALASGPLQALLPVLRPAIFRDIGEAEGVLRTSQLPYCIFRATRLTDDPVVGTVVAVPSAHAPPHRVSRKGLAHFIVDSLEQSEWVGREVTVGAAAR